VIWLPRSWGKTIQVTRTNGVADHLREVSDEIDRLEPAIKAAAFPIAGVLSCRSVADTGRMSMHGYAAAIDLNLKYSDYWLWAGKNKKIPYKNRMPLEIIDIFERHGFIWGGKWYHYDTMHLSRAGGEPQVLRWRESRGQPPAGIHSALVFHYPLACC